MAPGLPLSFVAICISHRQSLAGVGEGGFALLKAVTATPADHLLRLACAAPIESFSREQELVNPPYECDHGPLNFAGFAEARGHNGFRCRARPLRCIGPHLRAPVIGTSDH